MRGLGVENYDVVKVGRYTVEVFEDLVDDLDGPSRRGAASLRHDEPLEESGGRAEGSQQYSLIVRSRVFVPPNHLRQGHYTADCLAGKHANENMAGGRRYAGGTHQINRNERTSGWR